MRRLLIAAALAGLVALVVPASAHAQTRYVDVMFDEVQVTPDIPYGSAVNYLGETQELNLDLYEPVDDPDDKRAVFIWAHGGFFTSGNKSNVTGGGENSIKDVMTKRGWVTISVEYRLNPTLPEGIGGYFLSGGDVVNGVLRATEAIRNAQHDVQAAIRWVRKNADQYGFDPDRIATGGFSAGATTSMAVAFNSDDPGDSGNPGFPSNVQAAIGTGTGNLAFVDVHPDPLVEPPVAMFHGENDQTLPYQIPLLTCLTSQVLLNVCEFHLYPGEGHSSRNGINDWPAFLYTYVILRTPPPLSVPPGILPLLPSVHIPPGTLPALPIPTLPPEVTDLLPI